MINNPFTIATLKRVVLIAPVLLIGIITSFAGNNTTASDSILVKGVVVSGTNAPLSNITISIEGSREMPEVTNDAGEFSILSGPGDNWLIVSPVSDYKSKRIFLNKRDYIKIYMAQDDLTSGDDPLQILSQRKVRKDVVSSFFETKASGSYRTPAISIDEFLQGKAPGVNVVKSNGARGTGGVLSIRGVNSLLANTQPLYIIDGIPMESPGLFASNVEGNAYDPLLAVNMLDISSVTVVKDPAITSAYGSKGSNGIVFIETLDPSATQTSIDVDLRTGYSLAPNNQFTQLNALQHKALANEVLFTSGMFEESIRMKYPNLYLYTNDPRYI
ncbi:MAG: TonB-dependent receptor plug domain-containing protein, partial [Bacteroidota bacterium]|nr:TonB-dependent receptor plug domain-containing protein [Bacteroidota bacterium]